MRAELFAGEARTAELDWGIFYILEHCGLLGPKSIGNAQENHLSQSGNLWCSDSSRTPGKIVDPRFSVLCLPLGSEPHNLIPIYLYTEQERPNSQHRTHLCASLLSLYIDIRLLARSPTRSESLATQWKISPSCRYCVQYCSHYMR